MYVLCVLLHNDETWGESTIVSSLSNVEEVLGHRKSFEEVNLASCHQNLQTSSDILPSGTCIAPTSTSFAKGEIEWTPV